MTTTELALGERLDASEPFRCAGERLDLTLLDFWRWSEADLLATSTRARLAEFIVARLLGICTAGPRSDRSPDLRTPDGLAVRVKSASCVTCESRRDHSKIHFTPLPWRAPRRDPSCAAPLPHARVYVFALLERPERADVNPLDFAQWRFFVPPTAALEAKMRRQRTLSLGALEVLSGGPVPSGGLADAVRRAAAGG
ncbi:MAG TPA: hypothetical protein VGM13_16725 [Thermoanaerobaculia bacterium]|jgi:hypothetical protein